MSRESVELGELIFPAKVIRCGRDEYPVFSMTMHDGIVEQKTRFKKALASKDQSNYKVVKPGQLVVGFPIDEGVLYIQQLGKKGIMSPAYNIWDVDQEKVYPGFLELALHSPQSMSWYKAKLRGTTARRRNIPAKDLIKLRICLPEKSVQSRIVDTFQQIKEELSFFASLNEKLDDLVKSRFVEMFGDPISSLKYSRCLIGDLAVVSSGATPSRKKPEYYEGTIPWVKTGEVAAGNIDETEECITEAAIRDSACRILPAGTILIAMYGQGDTRGKSAILNIEAATNQACAALEFKDEIDARFALIFLQLCYDDLRNLSQGGNQKNLNLKIIKEYSMLTPPVYLQKEFANFVAQVDKLKFETQQSIEKLQMLYDSLAQEYFAPEGD